MGFAATEQRKLCERELCERIRDGGDGKHQQDVIHVEARVMMSKSFDLQVADGLNDGLGKEQDAVGNARELL